MKIKPKLQRNNSLSPIFLVYYSLLLLFLVTNTNSPQLATRQSDEQSCAAMISYNIQLNNDLLIFDSSSAYYEGKGSSEEVLQGQQ